VGVLIGVVGREEDLVDAEKVAEVLREVVLLDVGSRFGRDPELERVVLKGVSGGVP